LEAENILFKDEKCVPVFVFKSELLMAYTVSRVIYMFLLLITCFAGCWR